MEYIYLKFSLIEVSVLWEKNAKISCSTDFSSGTTAIGNRSMVWAATYIEEFIYDGLIQLESHEALF